MSNMEYGLRRKIMPRFQIEYRTQLTVIAKDLEEAESIAREWENDIRTEATQDPEHAVTVAMTKPKITELIF